MLFRATLGKVARNFNASLVVAIFNITQSSGLHFGVVTSIEQT